MKSLPLLQANEQPGAKSPPTPPSSAGAPLGDTPRHGAARPPQLPPGGSAPLQPNLHFSLRQNQHCEVQMALEVARPSLPEPRGPWHGVCVRKPPRGLVLHRLDAKIQS